MTRITAIASQKGGVGKTTTAVNLAYSLHLAGQRTLLIDLDPQANATSGLGCLPARLPPLGILADRPDSWPECITPSKWEGLDLVASCVQGDTTRVAGELGGATLSQLRTSLRSLHPAYDRVIIDCPPASGPIPRLALQLADGVLIPVQCEYYAMEGLSQMLPTVRQAEESRNRPLDIEGILLTLFECDLQLSREVHDEVRGYFPELTLRTVIPRDVALAESVSFGLPVFEYAVRSRGTWSYVQLAREVLHGRQETGQGAGVPDPARRAADASPPGAGDPPDPAPDDHGEPSPASGSIRR